MAKDISLKQQNSYIIKNFLDIIGLVMVKKSGYNSHVMAIIPVDAQRRAACRGNADYYTAVLERNTLRLRSFGGIRVYMNHAMLNGGEILFNLFMNRLRDVVACFDT